MLNRREALASVLAVTFSKATTLNAKTRMKVVVTGGHPGDPEAGCAGTIARYVGMGHDVVLLYLNRGEGFCAGGDLLKCGSIRTAEAQKACQILGARPMFAKQTDGRAVVDNGHYSEFGELLNAAQPDVVFTQWPIDNHRDHRAVSMLTLDAWVSGGRKWSLYYYEVAEDTMLFSPTEFVDISAPEIESRRHAACYSHASQYPDKWYPPQVEITRFRGSQSGHAQAEAFVRHWQSAGGMLP